MLPLWLRFYSPLHKEREGNKNTDALMTTQASRGWSIIFQEMKKASSQSLDCTVPERATSAISRSGRVVSCLRTNAINTLSCFVAIVDWLLLKAPVSTTTRRANLMNLLVAAYYFLLHFI
jgi:hypothetical protein